MRTGNALQLGALTMMTTMKKERSIKMKARAENIHMNLMSTYSSKEIRSPVIIKSLNSLLSSVVIKYLKYVKRASERVETWSDR